MDVVFHALDTLGGDFDAVVLLQLTSPLGLEAGDIRRHRRAPGEGVPYFIQEHPVEWLYRMEGCLSPVLPGKNAHQRQNVDRPNGALVDRRICCGRGVS